MNIRILRRRRLSLLAGWIHTDAKFQGFNPAMTDREHEREWREEDRSERVKPTPHRPRNRPPRAVAALPDEEVAGFRRYWANLSRQSAAIMTVPLHLVRDAAGVTPTRRTVHRERPCAATRRDAALAHS